MSRGLLMAFLFGMMAQPASAHPHVFIETGLQFQFDDQGRLAGLWVVWAYDDFYSLLVLEDKGLDPDADGVLTKAEEKQLDGFDMGWDAGFAGDLYALQAGQPLALSRPLQHGAKVQGGRIVTTHFRAFDPPLVIGAEPVVVQAYDPTYYTAYTLSLPVTVTGRSGCETPVLAPDPEAVPQELQAALAELGATQTLDDLGIDDFPAIGASMAEEVHLTCAP